MAARVEAVPPAASVNLVDLRRIAARQIDPLLEEERQEWKELLEWEFEKSADLVRRFVDLHALNGCALIEQGTLTGYAYFVLEESKGLIGDLYVRRRWRCPEREDLLLRGVLDAMAASSSVRRIESQLMTAGTGGDRPLPRASHLSAFTRNFMRVELKRAGLGEGRVRRPVRLERWSDHFHEPAAKLIAAAYEGHIDSRINDQYRSAGGARRFLYNIVQYPGCGTFYRPASWTAFDIRTGALLGMSLASLVAPGCGHITQICVAPEAKNLGIGYLLLRQSLTVLRDYGCRAASLTVTAANTEAVSLYERVGFRTVRQFSAYVWDL
jgi:ribosomal protein S18 acetylase RimI-like enzyme